MHHCMPLLSSYVCDHACSLTENISEYGLVYHAQVFSIREDINRAMDPH